MAICGHEYDVHVRRWVADAPLIQEFAIFVEHLYAMVIAVVHEDAPGLNVDCDAVHAIEVAGSGFVRRIALLAPGGYVFAVFIELHHAGVGIAIGDEHGAIGKPSQVGGPVEVLVVVAVLIGHSQRQHQLFHVVGKFEDGVPVVIDQPDKFVLVIRIDVNGMRSPKHFVPLGPGLDNVPLGVHRNQTMLPAPVDILLAPIGAIQRTWRAGRRGVAPRQTSDGKTDARTQFCQFDFFGSLNVRQLAALQDEDAIRILGEDPFRGTPSPLLISRQRRKRLRPIWIDIIGAENILTTDLPRDSGERGIGFDLSLDACGSAQYFGHYGKSRGSQAAFH